MREGKRVRLRLAFVFVMVLAVSLLVISHAAAGGVTGGDGSNSDPSGDGSDVFAGSPTADTWEGKPVNVHSQFGLASQTALPAETWSARRVDAATTGTRNVTVVANQGFASIKEGALVAFLPNGSIVYYDDTYQTYFDVDAVAGTRYTVEYVTAVRREGEVCRAVGEDECTENLVRRVNLTTGAEQTIYGELTHRTLPSMRYHDFDRWNETTIVVADIIRDGVYAVDTRDGNVLWRWSASENYGRHQGGAKGDWTHINDVEVLPDGRVMVSVRNMDSVVFLEVADGEAVMNESWTLGSDDDYDVLHEQHNPDYIPASRGGPAVVVADSETGRIVEFQRVDGEWTESWHWRDARLQWPRDADRLPDGDTLVVDSHGNRVVEVAPNGSVVWSARVGMPYDVERLGTGDESSGGPSMTRIQARWNGTGSSAMPAGNEPGGAIPPSTSTWDAFWLAMKKLAPSLVVNGLLYVAPSWVQFTDLVFGGLLVVTGATWAWLELHWAGYSVRAQVRRRGAGLLARGRVVRRRLDEELLRLRNSRSRR